MNRFPLFSIPNETPDEMNIPTKFRLSTDKWTDIARSTQNSVDLIIIFYGGLKNTISRFIL